MPADNSGYMARLRLAQICLRQTSYTHKTSYEIIADSGLERKKLVRTLKIERFYNAEDKIFDKGGSGL